MQRIIISLLGLALVVQVGILAARFGAEEFAPAAAALLTPGDSVPRIRGLDSTGRAVSYPIANPEHAATLVLAFDTDCAHTEAVREEWRGWLDSHRSLRTIAVARNSIAPAIAYRDAQRWALPVLSLRDPRAGTPEYSLAGRSPWLFLFDDDGVLRWEGHGARISEVEEVLATLPLRS